jgi:hypothetical protein
MTGPVVGRESAAAGSGPIPGSPACPLRAAAAAGLRPSRFACCAWSCSRGLAAMSGAMGAACPGGRGRGRWLLSGHLVQETVTSVLSSTQLTYLAWRCGVA